MGFFFRKSIKFGPLRVNLSKSGVGLSAGVKGFRVSAGPRGTYLNAGRGGLYYRQKLSGGAYRSDSNGAIPTSSNGSSALAILGLIVGVPIFLLIAATLIFNTNSKKPEPLPESPQGYAGLKGPDVDNQLYYHKNLLSGLAPLKIPTKSQQREISYHKEAIKELEEVKAGTYKYPYAVSSPTPSALITTAASSSSYSGSGSVNVRGYYRKDGTYVRAHTRSR